MAYVITEQCTKDNKCVEVCPVDCIHPRKDEAGFDEAAQLFVSPIDCIDCGACVPVCEASAIYTLDELPEQFTAAAEKNAQYYA
jgi:NAD-dependent dihydropyrimidine dehydrogenase PreA subunit